jgi:uncharacterized protein
LDKGADAIFDVLRGKYKGTRKHNNSNGSLPLLIFLVIFIVVLIILSKNKGNVTVSGIGGPNLLDILILSSLGRSSGGGFGGSSGGSGGFGGGFGGGGFSGGGAGGSW